MPDEPQRGGGARASAAALAVVSAAAIGVLGSELFFARTDALGLVFALVCGLVAVTACREPLDAAAAAAAGAALGVLGAAALSGRTLLSPYAQLPSAASVVAAAAAVAGALAFLGARRERLRSGALLAALALLIAAMWLAGTAEARRPLSDGTVVATWLGETPRIELPLTDVDLYRAYVGRMRAGQPYHAAVAAVTSEKNAIDPVQVPLDSPLVFRPPTLYWALARLPADGWSTVLAALTVGSLALAAGYSAAGAFVRPALALVAAAGVAAYFARLTASVQILHTEAWGGALGIVSVAALLHAKRRAPGAGRWALLVAAAGAAVAAACLRELGVAFVVLGLAATLADRDLRTTRAWIPWVAGLILVGVLGWSHWSLAAQAASAVPEHLRGAVAGAGGGAGGRIDPDLLGVAAVVDLGAYLVALPSAGMWLVLGLSTAGAIGAPRDVASRVLLAGCVLGGALAVFLARAPHAPGTPPPSYWGLMVLPAWVAIAPLALALVPGWRREDTPDGSGDRARVVEPRGAQLG